MSDSSLRAAIPTSEADLKFIKSGYANIPHLLDDKINFPAESICVYHDNFLYHFSEKVSNTLIEAGIIQYWFKYFVDFDLKPLLNAPSEPKVFEVEDLKFGFCVWLVASAISVAAFFGEILYFNAMIKIKRTAQKYGKLYFFIKFLKKGCL